jgi:hypothetical protein
MAAHLLNLTISHTAAPRLPQCPLLAIREHPPDLLDNRLLPTPLSRSRAIHARRPRHLINPMERVRHTLDSSHPMYR